MLYPTHFYNAQTRKILVAFANLLKDIDVVRKDGNTNEIHRERVPITYSSKAKFIQRLVQDLNASKDIALKLPRIAFNLQGFAYSPERKVNTRRKFHFQDGDNSRSWTYGPLAYDMDFEVTVTAKTQEEALQIIEQIVPFFTPDYNVSVRLLDDQTESFNIPFSLVSVAPDDQYDGPFEDNRVITWTLNFVGKAILFGPLRTTGKIRAVLVNYYDLDTQSLTITDVKYGTDLDNIDEILDYDNTSGIPGITTPSSSETTNANVVSATQGTALSTTLQLIDDQDAPIDLTGVSLRGWIRKNLSSSDFRNLTISVVGTPTNGQISIAMTGANTSKLSLGDHIYEIEIDFPDGSSDRGASGIVRVSPKTID